MLTGLHLLKPEIIYRKNIIGGEKLPLGQDAGVEHNFSPPIIFFPCRNTTRSERE